MDAQALTEFLDHDSDDPGERAVKLYYAVRVGLLYEVYGADLSREALLHWLIA